MRTDDAARHLSTTLQNWDPGATIETRLGGGTRNDVWSVRIAGTRYAARQSSRASASLEWELALLLDLDRAGLWVPTPLPTRDGRLHVDGLAVLTWMDGELPQSTEDWRMVEATLGVLHRCTSDYPQRPGFRSAHELLTGADGGDVHLDRMPPDVAVMVRAAWCPLTDEPQAVIHGDPNGDNVRIANGRVGLLDWDEARVDTPLFDLAALPLERLEGVTPDQRRAARRAAVAWEAANGWTTQPEYANRRLEELQEMLSE